MKNNNREIELAPYVFNVHEESTPEKIINRAHMIKNRYGLLESDDVVYLVGIASMKPWEKAKYLLGSNDYMIPVVNALRERYPNAYLIYDPIGDVEC